MYCFVNVGEEGDVSIFFGLLGIGKIILSVDLKCKFIGDDEYCWIDDGVFNIEGGCYVKVIDLSLENELDIYNVICFGIILENVVYDKVICVVDYFNIFII